MTDLIRIMIVDDITETRENIGRLISLEEGFQVVAEAQDAENGVRIAQEVQPDIILMDINLPGMDGLKATELLSQELPQTSIIMISVQEEQYYMRRAMSAGARGFLMKPFSRDELAETIRRVHNIEIKRRHFQQNPAELKQPASQVITVFSGKGGVGKTTISVNLAIALAQVTGEEVVILDLDLQFGDVALMMDLNPTVTIANAADEIDSLIPESLESYLLKHRSGVKVLAAPLRPEEAELVKGADVVKLLHLLRQSYRYILVDTAPTFQEINLAVLDQANQIVLVSLLELATIKNIHLSLQIMEQLNYPKEKINLILNRAGTEYGLGLKDMEKTLDMAVKVKIPNDGGVALRALNTGEPFVLSNPKTAIARGIFELAQLAGPDKRQETAGGLLTKMKHLLNK